MMDERDDLLREIGAEMDVAPRADFAARVRARVEAEPAHGSPWLWPVVATVGVAVAVVLFLGPSGRRAPTNASEHAAGGKPAPAVVVAGRGPALVDATSSRDGAGVARPAPRRVTVRRATEWARSTPDVLIAPDQVRLLRELMLAVAEGRVVMPPSSDPSVLEPMAVAELPAPMPIEIPMIEIEPLADSQGA